MKIYNRFYKIKKDENILGTNQNILSFLMAQEVLQNLALCQNFPSVYQLKPYLGNEKQRCVWIIFRCTEIMFLSPLSQEWRTLSLTVRFQATCTQSSNLQKKCSEKSPSYDEILLMFWHLYPSLYPLHLMLQHLLCIFCTCTLSRNFLYISCIPHVPGFTPLCILPSSPVTLKTNLQHIGMFY